MSKQQKKKKQKRKTKPYGGQMVWIILGCIVIGLLVGYGLGKLVIYPKLHEGETTETAISEGEQQADELLTINQEIYANSDDNSETQLEGE